MLKTINQQLIFFHPDDELLLKKSVLVPVEPNLHNTLEDYFGF